MKKKPGVIAAAVSEPEANERGSSLIGRRALFFFEIKWVVVKGERNCGYARMAIKMQWQRAMAMAMAMAMSN